MRIRYVVFGLSLACVLVGCTPAAPVHDKAYYLAHPSEGVSVTANCRNNPDQVGRSSNCGSAAAAAGQAESDRFWAIKKPKTRVAHPNSL